MPDKIFDQFVVDGRKKELTEQTITILPLEIHVQLHSNNQRTKVTIWPTKPTGAKIISRLTLHSQQTAIKLAIKHLTN